MILLSILSTLLLSLQSLGNRVIDVPAAGQQIDPDYSDFDHSSRISRGFDVSAGQYPSHVSLILGKTICSGALITKRLVITANHCLKDGYSQAIVIASHHGYPFHLLNQENGEYRIADSCQIGNSSFDIVVAKLDRPIDQTADIEPISISQEPARVGEELEIVGSGFSDNSETLPAIVKYFKAKTVECDVDLDYREFRICFSNKIRESRICKGDSGGPVFRRRPDGDLKLVGVIHGGTSPSCGDEPMKTVITHVARYRDNITDELENCGFL